MKIVVTGALGHIGSRLIRQLPAAFPGAEIVLLDDLSTQRYCSLFNLPAGSRYRFLEVDILKGDLKLIFNGAQIVVHLAALTNAEASVAIPDEVEHVNFKGTKRVADACAACGSGMVFISTTSVYGVQSEEVDEECPVEQLKPQSPYAASKLKAELLLREMGEREGLNFVICRFGTIFGVSPGMRFHTAVNKFCWQAVMGQPVTVWRTALNQKRPYLDLRDAVEALNFIIQRKLLDGRIYNILTTNTTVKSVLDAISLHVPDISVQYVDTKIMNQLSYNVRNDRFAKLGFECKGSLEEGIADTIHLFREVCPGRSNSRQ